jgi:uncharacterized protein YecE (DUF72 family)
MTRHRESQMSLFGADTPGPAGSPGAHLAELAARLRRWPLYLGTSSWSFPGWAGLVYPPGLGREALARDGLLHYGRHPLLRTVGVDRSYYGPLSAGQYADYARQVPDDFRFLVKALRDLTTPALQLPAGARAPVQRYLDRDYCLQAVIEPLRHGLGPKAYGVMFQFPPLSARVTQRPKAFLDGLQRLLSGLPRELRYFVEIRNPELYTVAYFDVLAAAGANHCFTVHPNAPPLAEQRELANGKFSDTLFIRWNLRRDRQYAQARDEFQPFDRLVVEDPETRQQAAELVAAALKADRPVFVIANNKAEGSAPLTLEKLALALSELL